MSKTLVVVAALACALAAGCKSEKEAAPPPAPKPEKKKSNIVDISTAVAPGQQIACEKVFDPAKMATETGLDIGSMRDRSKSNSEMTAVCAFMRAGDAPKTEAQLAAARRSAGKMGVLPGDEWCTVSIGCSVPVTAESLKEKCEADSKNAPGMTQYEDNDALGQYACVRKTDRPPSDWAYTFRTVDSDTGCLVEVMGGPSVVQQEIVQKCTSAGLTLLTEAGLANP